MDPISVDFGAIKLKAGTNYQHAYANFFGFFGLLCLL
jgi:hypothetical protein